MTWVRIFIFFILILPSFHATSQSSLHEEVSYPYLERLVRIARENYPRIALNQKHIDIAEKNITKAKLSWFEVLGFFYLYNPYSSSPLTYPRFLNGALNGSQFGISVNIGNIVQKPNQIRLAKDELDIAKLQYHEYYLGIEAIVKDRYFKYMQHLSIVKARSRSVLDVGILLNSIKNKFEKGEETFENYSKALVLYSDQNQLKTSAEASMMSAKAFLEEILNKKLEEIN